MSGCSAGLTHGRHKCPLCPQMVNSFEECQLHLSTTHIINCMFCTMVLTSMDDVVTHVRSTHMDELLAAHRVHEATGVWPEAPPQTKSDKVKFYGDEKEWCSLGEYARFQLLMSALAQFDPTSLDGVDEGHAGPPGQRSWGSREYALLAKLQAAMPAFADEWAKIAPGHPMSVGMQSLSTQILNLRTGAHVILSQRGYDIAVRGRDDDGRVLTYEEAKERLAKAIGPPRSR